MTRFRVNLFEHFIFGEHTGAVWDAGAESAKPVRGIGKRRDEIPAHKNEGEGGDEDGLNQGSERGRAQNAHHASLNVAGVGNNHNDTEKFSLVDDGKRIDVQSGILNGNKIAGRGDEFHGAKCFRGRLIESHGESRGNGANGAGRIVNSDAAEAFAWYVTIEKMA